MAESASPAAIRRSAVIRRCRLSGIGSRCSATAAIRSISEWAMLGGFATLHFANLPAGPGTGWQKRDRDSESMTTDPAPGRSGWGSSVIMRSGATRPGFARAERHAAPSGDGALAEQRRARIDGAAARRPLHRPRAKPGAGRMPKGMRRYEFDRDPTIDPSAGFRFAYAPPHGYDPSDAIELPDGDLLVLNRRFSLPYDLHRDPDDRSARANRTGEGSSRASRSRLSPRRMIHDNFEALAVTQRSAARRSSGWRLTTINRCFSARCCSSSGSIAADTTTAPPR